MYQSVKNILLQLSLPDPSAMKIISMLHTHNILIYKIKIYLFFKLLRRETMLNVGEI